MLSKVDFNATWYKNFVEHTDEKDILVNKIYNLLKGEKVKSCLEIGLGISPYFAMNLRDKFQRYLIIEKNIYKETLPDGLKLLNADWETAKLDEKFDVIIASHVIYYFKDKKAAIEKMFNCLNPNGKIFFVVNGKTADYGPLKYEFQKVVGCDYKFTYDELLNCIKKYKTTEYTVPSNICFSSYDELFEILKLSFDAWPEEYIDQKNKMIKYLQESVKSNKFIIDQKIIRATK